MKHHGRIIQDNMVVVSVSAPTEKEMLAGIHHYAAMYASEGLVTIETRSGSTRWKEPRP